MVFSSIIFLLFFLPVTLTFYYVAGPRFRNIILLISSLFFYTWGEGTYVLVMLLSICTNFFLGLLLEKTREKTARKRIIVAGVSINLLSLFYFKYISWLAATAAKAIPLLATTDLVQDPIHLPIGISFFTFQAISYIVDVYRGTNPAQKNPFHLGLYIASFPQLIAGPIVRYHHVAQQIVHRRHSFILFASGVEKFIFGLSKKVLIANPMAAMGDRIFALDYQHLPPEIAWLAIICYTLQIYYDFSGYSDMAIGLGRMFGFHFQENFNLPYIARSIQDFWQRWHISLSQWLRDYLYIPLGGNRKGDRRTYANLFIVFLLCGLWHGASWNFVIWGLIHGSFLVLERRILQHWLDGKPRLVGHCYALFVVVNAWVFFRIEDLSDSLLFLKAMYCLSPAPGTFPMIEARIDGLFLTSLCMGILFSTPLFSQAMAGIHAYLVRTVGGSRISVSTELLKTSALFFLLYTSISFLAVNSYNPFIYFRF